MGIHLAIFFHPLLLINSVKTIMGICPVVLISKRQWALILQCINIAKTEGIHPTVSMLLRQGIHPTTQRAFTRQY